MFSRGISYSLIVHLLIYLNSPVTTHGDSLGNDLADAGKYLSKRPLNVTQQPPASRGNRAAPGLGNSTGSNNDTSVFPFSSHDRCASEHIFKCADGACISDLFICDGRPDCSDESDESKETCKHGIFSGNCKDYKFECSDGECIPNFYRCDGDNDCSDGSDESNCECRSNEFKCRNRKCVANFSVCDGVKDCEGGDDEEHCGNGHCPTIAGYYHCGSGECVPWGKVCDGINDCANGSDEGLACATKCKPNNTCTGNCTETPKGPHCTCKEGFALQGDNVTCADENECQWRHKLACDHFCSNRNGSFHCACHSNYILQEDNVTCKHKGKGEGFLLVAQEGSIQQIFLEKPRTIQIYLEQKMPVIGLGFDPVEKAVFWSTSTKIMKESLIGDTLPQTVLNIGVNMAESLAVDWTARNIYITDPQFNHIMVCTIDGSFCRQLLTNLGRPRTVQVDMLHRYMYWTDIKYGRIGKAGMDGSNPIVLVEDGLVWPNCLALDVPAGRLYWLDANKNEAHSAKLDGSDRKTLHMATVRHPYSMALWEDRLYWTDWDHTHIVSCNKRDGKHKHTELKGLHKLQYFGLVVFHPAMMEKIENPCKINPCSHLCLLSPLHLGYTCACPSGIMELHEDKRTCIDTPERIYVIVSSFNMMYRVSPHHYGRADQHAWMPHMEICEIGDLVYSPDNDVVFVSDQEKRKIYSVSMKSESKSVLLNNTVARQMDLDWLRNNLYWLDSDDTVQMMKLDMGMGVHRKTVLSNLSAPLDIAVAPLAGLLFVSSSNSMRDFSSAHIKKCGLDGRDCEDLVIRGIGKPDCLAVDHENNHLYFSDGFHWHIERMNFNGTNISEIPIPMELTHFGPVASLMVISNSLFWTVENKWTIYMIPVDSVGGNDIVETMLDVEVSEGTMGLRETGRLKLTRVKWRFPNMIEERPCSNNGGCSEICAGNATKNEVCLCGFSSDLNDDGRTCKQIPCPESQFQCIESRRCILKEKRCDMFEDCSDGSDERECPFSCGQHHQCGTTDVCVSKTKVCDKKKDCDDGSDEDAKLCCPNGHFCDNNTKCVYTALVCNQHFDCQDESDEANCRCPIGKVQCRNGQCVTRFEICDGRIDCKDGSDEDEYSNCTEMSTSSIVTKSTSYLGARSHCGEDFKCKDGGCVPAVKVCDRQRDCHDGSDEQESCQVRCNVTLCSHGCEVRHGSFQCTCPFGYRLANVTTCERVVGEDWVAVAVNEGFLNYTHTYQHWSTVHFPASALPAFYTTYAVDSVTGDLFYTTMKSSAVNKLVRRPDGVVTREVFLSGRSGPRSLCCDPIRRNLYMIEVFASSEGRLKRSLDNKRSQEAQEDKIIPKVSWTTIMACNMDGKGCSVVIGSSSMVLSSVTVAEREKLLFFCSSSTPKTEGMLMSSYLDGTNMKKIWIGIKVCHQVAVDEAKRLVYWSDVLRGTIETVTLEGDLHSVHMHKQNWSPLGLAVVGSNLLWLDSQRNSLLICPKVHFNSTCKEIKYSERLYGFVTAPLPLLPAEQGECGNASCSEICASGGSGCMCVTGYQRSSSNPTKCDKLTTCEDNKCKGGSTCEAHSAEHYICRCPEGREGRWCEIGGSSNTGIIAGVLVVVFVVVVLLLLILYYCWKASPFTILKRKKNRNGERGYHFVNPAFGIMHDQPIIEVEAQQHCEDSPYDPPSYNNSFQRNVGNPSKHEEKITISDDSAVGSMNDSVLAS